MSNSDSTHLEALKTARDTIAEKLATKEYSDGEMSVKRADMADLAQLEDLIERYEQRASRTSGARKRMMHVDVRRRP
jgi:hypothetical protein